MLIRCQGESKTQAKVLAVRIKSLACNRVTANRRRDNKKLASRGQTNKIDYVDVFNF